MQEYAVIDAVVGYPRVYTRHNLDKCLPCSVQVTTIPSVPGISGCVGLNQSCIFISAVSLNTNITLHVYILVEEIPGRDYASV